MVPEPILVADYEMKRIFLLRQILNGDGYCVITASKGEQAIQMAENEKPALVILSMVFAGGVDGFEAVRRIREFSDVPILLLANHYKPEDALRGYDLGADDYMVHPIDPKIFLARIRVILRRCHNLQKNSEEIICSDLVIDLAAHRVIHKGVEIYLTDTEYNLLLTLARNRNRVLMHDQLLAAVWGKEFRNEVGYLRSYVHILRRKLEDDPLQPRLIISRPGIGYMLVAAQEKDPGE